MDAYARDQAALLAERISDGRIGRRALLAVAGAMASSGIAHGAAKELVLSCWGGLAVQAYEKAFGAPFAKDTGIPVVIDSSGPSLGKIKAMVESGKVGWDICDSSAGSSEALGRQNLLEPIDYALVDKSQTIPEFAMKWCYGTSAYSYVLAWDKKATGGATPAAWADVWDLKRFPGKRTFRKSMHGVLEAALLADGVPRAGLYPLDVERGFAKLKQILPEVLFWDAGADSEKLLREGEVAMGSVWSTRARNAEENASGRVAWAWDGGQITSGVFNVPRGNPAGKDAMRFLDAMNTPARQVVFLEMLGSGPANPAAAALVPAALKRLNPTDPVNAAVQVVMQDAWYGEHYERVYPRFRDLIAS